MIEAWEDRAPDLSPENFINRELSTIDFQKRVLALAEDETTPLLERVKFIAIVGNNLDEFYMVRVGAYFQRLEMSNPLDAARRHDAPAAAAAGFMTRSRR